MPQGGGAFIVTGESGDQRAIVRSPDGVTWTPASQRPPGCGAYVLGIAHGNDVTVVVSGHGFICRSPDAGDTWTQVAVSEGFSSPPVWTGAEFFVYAGNVVHRSATGEVWTRAVTRSTSWPTARCRRARAARAAIGSRNRRQTS